MSRKLWRHRIQLDWLYTERTASLGNHLGKLDGKCCWFRLLSVWKWKEWHFTLSSCARTVRSYGNIDIPFKVPTVNTRELYVRVLAVIRLNPSNVLIKSYNRTKLCGNQSDNEYLLFEGVTNIKRARLSHNSQIKEQCDLSAKASGSCGIYDIMSKIYSKMVWILI